MNYDIRVREEFRLAIFPTRVWLTNYINECKGNHIKSEFLIQRDVIIKPLQQYFPQEDIEDIHHFLLNMGLFSPIYWSKLEERIEQMNSLNIWDKVNKEYMSLKEKWNGSNADIFILPLNTDESYFQEELCGKNGVGFRNKILLFIDESIPLKEINALLTHEYNHVCRLQFLGEDPEELSLKESLIIEGLAEVAVEERFGKQALAPLTSQYSVNEAKYLYQKYLQPRINLTNKKNHDQFLNGNKAIPKRLGYSVGYRIITSYLSNNPTVTMKELLKTPSDSILDGSHFK